MSITIESQIHFTRAKAGRKQLAAGPEPKPSPAPPDPIPRVSRLMALAIHFDGLIRQGVVRDYADLARLGGVSRARITQIMNLLNLPPTEQEELLFLEGGPGRSRVTERELRSMEGQSLWKFKDTLKPTLCRVTQPASEPF
jgi:hypothetical protein